ncbi:hypothetical protein ACC689_07855 [Rhizobium ruizarguesonis]
MRDLIDTAFRNFRVTEFDDALGLPDADDVFFDETKGRDGHRHLCSIRSSDD